MIIEHYRTVAVQRSSSWFKLFGFLYKHIERGKKENFWRSAMSAVGAPWSRVTNLFSSILCRDENKEGKEEYRGRKEVTASICRYGLRNTHTQMSKIECSWPPWTPLTTAGKHSGINLYFPRKVLNWPNSANSVQKVTFASEGSTSNSQKYSKRRGANSLPPSFGFPALLHKLSYCICHTDGFAGKQ